MSLADSLNCRPEGFMYAPVQGNDGRHAESPSREQWGLAPPNEQLQL